MAQFSFTWKCLEDISAGCGILVWQFFYFSKRCATFFWPPWFLMKICCHSSCLFSIAKVSFFYGYLQYFFFVFSFQEFNYYVFWCGFLWVYSVRDSLSFFSLLVYVPYQLGVFIHYFFKYFLTPLSFYSPSGTLVTQMLGLLLQSNSPWRSVYFFQFPPNMFR